MRRLVLVHGNASAWCTSDSMGDRKLEGNGFV